MDTLKIEVDKIDTLKLIHSQNEKQKYNLLI